MKFAALLFGLVFAGTAWADIGSVTELSGIAIIKRGKETIQVSKGTSVAKNDKVETKNGRLKIVFADNTTVTVTESSALVIDDFVYDSSKGSGKLDLKATAGTVRYVSGNIAKDPRAVNIKTPTASIAVRGTNFVMAVNEIGGSTVILMPDQDIDPKLNLSDAPVTTGSIEVESGASKILMNQPFQATVVESVGSVPSAPVVVNSAALTTIGNNILLSEFKVEDKSQVASREAKDYKKEAKDEQSAAFIEKNEDHKVKVIETENKTTVAINTSALGFAVTQSNEDNVYVSKVYRNNDGVTHIGWLFSISSDNDNNYASIVVGKDSKSLVVVSQDLLINAHNFNSASVISNGLIVINQVYK